MTTFSQVSFTCACCGSPSEGVVLSSTNAFGSMDLDMRPPPMQRDTLAQQIHQCSECGYCSPDLEDAEGIDPAVVHGRDYQSISTNLGYPPLARRFLAYAHLAAVAGDHRSTAWAMLRAAWVCDDTGAEYVDQSVTCRNRVSEALHGLHAQRETFTNDQQTDGILRLDVLRRAGRFDEAIAEASRLQATQLPDILDKIAAFQILQARNRNVDCYTVSDVLE